MKTITKEIYFCDFCNKLYQRKHACIEHEKRCNSNPDNHRACFGCDYCVKKEIEYSAYGIVQDGVYVEQKMIVNILYCMKLKKYVYPPSVEHKNNPFELGDEFNDPMRS